MRRRPLKPETPLNQKQEELAQRELQLRDEMEKLLAAENPEPQRRAQFIASFNRGYRSFEGTYSNCTASATEAIARYTREGESLSRDIAARYGN